MNRVLAKLALLAVLCTTSIAALAGDITGIKFQQDGEYTFPEKQLMFNIQSREDQEFSQKVLDQDVKRLFSTGMFSDVRADIQEDDLGDVSITFYVSPKTVVSAIEIDGNKKFSDEELKKEITLLVNNPQNDQQLRDSLSNLRKFYSAKGYQDATVSSRFGKSADGQLVVTFDIKEHLKQKVNSVSFEGNNEFTSWRLKHTVDTQYSLFSWLFDTGLFVREQLETDKQKLREIYLEEGFLDFEVKDIQVVETEDPEYVDVTFVLEEGLPYVLGTITVSGNESVSSDILEPGLKAVKGNTYRVSKEYKDLAFIGRKYGARGYADYTCQVIKKPDYAAHVVDVEYKIVEGGQYTVRNINITGNKATKDYVLRREVKLQPGGILDQTRIKLDKQRIMNLGNYSKVEAVTVNAGVPGQKDLNITVEEKKTMNLKLGAGYSDVDSAMGMIELSETNFDISDPSNYFRGAGQTARLRAMIGGRRSSFSLDFTEPYMWDEPIGLNVKAYHTESYYNDWDETRTGAEVSLSQRELFDEFNTATLGLRFEKVKISDVDDDLSQTFHDEEGSDYVSTISFGFNRDARDSKFAPTEGYELNGLAELTSQALGASNNYYRLEAKASQYVSLLDDALILHTGAKVGVIDSTDGGPVPMYERYFLGGGESLRGFPWREVSPVDGNEDPVGGESMFLANVELMHPIYDSIKGAVFTDIGGVGAEAGDFGFEDIGVGVGYGLRVRVPQLNAPMKFDIAYPIVKGRSHIDRKLRFHFNMGFSW